jgi:hypothetical protein
MTHTVDEWQGCYPSQWRGIITQEAIVHPAKFSNKLIRRIYEHMLSEGWLKEDDSVIDPFGGVALGAFDAMRLGLNWYGSELEKKFVELGNGNINMWKKRYTWWKGNAILLQGDSRHLLEVLGTVSHKGAISSPPYAEGLGHNTRKITEIDLQKKLYGKGGSLAYGESDGQLAQMPATEDGLKAAISSPPYADSINSENNGIDWSKTFDADKRFRPDEPAFDRIAGMGAPLKYDGSISSPPFTDSLHDVNVQQPARRLLADEQGESNSENISPIDMEKIGKRGKSGYSGVVSSPPYSDGCQHTGGDTLTSADHIAGGDVHLPGIQGVLSSPPYSEARIGEESGQEHCGNGDQYGATPGQLGAMNSVGFKAALASPPYAGMQVEKSSSSIDYAKQYKVYKANGGGQSFEAFVKTQELHSQGCGDSEGQLSSMPKGDFNAAITSPPFRQQSGGTNPTPSLEERYPGVTQRHIAGNAAANGYGKTAGQLANMGEGDFDSAVTSPPFNENKNNVTHGETKGFHSNDENESKNRMKRDYVLPENPSNLGQEIGDDFWSAARTIVEQTFLALVDGGHAVWVVKGFVKNKELVDFPGQWRQLCEAVGFETLHEHHATLVHHKGTSITLEGEDVHHQTESKSFFRRLAEKKGSPRIDYETVFCMIKPIRTLGSEVESSHE